MERKRNRRPVVCNVCRKRKVKCDRAKPACSACRKSNCVHLCIYEEREGRRGRLPTTLSPPGTPSQNARDSGFNLRQKNAISTQVPIDKQQRLQKENQQFQQQFQLQQNYQHNLQNQMAAKYGVTGANQAMPPQPPQQLSQGQQQPIYNPQLGYLGMPPVYDPQQMPHPLPGGFIPWGQQGQMLPITQPFMQQPGMIENGQMPFQQIPGAPGFMPQFQAIPNPQLLTPQQQLQLQNVPFGLQPDNNNGENNNGNIPGPNHETNQQIDEDEENIDPSLYNSDEITNIFQEYTKNSEFVDVENDGLFGNSTFIKKDTASTLFYLNLLKFNGTSSPSNPNKPSNRFSKALENQTSSKVENYYKHESVNLNDILKRIAKILPNKKIIWLMIDKFFTGFSNPFLPILNEDEFISDISRIIGEKELIDLKPKLTIDLDDNENLVNLFYLIVIIRLSQLSLIMTINLDKQNNYLLKNSQNSTEYDVLIDLLFSSLQNIKVSKISKLKILLIKEVLSLVNLDSDLESFNSSLVAIELNLNNKHQTRANPTLNQTWFFTYFAYYYTHLKKGLPLLYNQDSFNLDFIFNPIGENYRKSLIEDYNLQVKTNEIFLKLFNRIYDYSNNDGIPIENIKKWLNELNNSKDINFNMFKNEIYPNYSKKILKTMILIFAKFVNLNILQYLLIHYENSLSKVKFSDTLNESIKMIQESVDVSFDILKNYSTYFHSGNEFILLPQILMILDKVLSFLQVLFIRSYMSGKPSLSTLKSIIFIVEELEGFPSLGNYFLFWKITYRSKCFLHLFKKEENGKISILNHNFEINDKKIKFEEIKTNFHNFSDEDFNEFEKNLDLINEKFDDSPYFKLRSVEAFFSKLECEEPEFNIELFR